MKTDKEKKAIAESDLICELIVKEGLISTEQLEQARNTSINSNEPIEWTLTDMGLVSIDSIASLLERHHNVPFIDVLGLGKTHILDVFPEKMLRKYRVIPIEVQEDKLILAMTDPKNLQTIDDVQMLTGYKVVPRLILNSSFEKFMDKYYHIDKVEEIVSEIKLEKILPNAESSTLKEQLETSAPIIKLVNSIIESAIQFRASDIHIEPQEKNVMVRFRIDGILRTIDVVPKTLQPHIISRIKIMCNLDIVQTRMPQDGQVSIKVFKRVIMLRSSFMPSKYGEKIVLRIFDKSTSLLNLSQLFMPEAIEKTVEEIIQQPDGMMIVTGPTGSGKTTSLYAMINYIKSPYKNIITFEDPIEFELLSGRPNEGGITQVNINSAIGFDFVQGLRVALRQDPDVIFVGEIRDEETATIAMRAALTGHFVMTTLHTLNSFETVTRLRDMGIEPYLIASCLKGVLAQRLVRILCPKCKEIYTPSEHIMKRLNLTDFNNPPNFYRAQGCSYCSNTGYYGRVGVYELLVINDEIRKLIMENKDVIEIKNAACKAGTKVLLENGIQLVVEGKTSVAEIMRVL